VSPLQAARWASLHPGEAARIFTGAHVPIGADTVAVQEDAVTDGRTVSFPVSGPPAARGACPAAGHRFCRRNAGCTRGDRLSPPRLGLVAAAGLGAVNVHRRPRVALLSTGDELVAPGATPSPGQIIGSNALMIASLLHSFDAEVTDLGIVGDRRDALAAAIETARGHDLLVTIGGASVGDHDLVKPVLQAAGAEIDFWKVAIRPGKPLLAGRMGGRDGATLVVGLPGNPVSAFVCARIFLGPLLRHLAGNRTPHDRAAVRHHHRRACPNGQRRDFMRATTSGGPEGPMITPARAQDSSLLSVLAGANALLIRPEHAPALAAGQRSRC
jgi:molybdopterin molybdotransferase